MTMLKLLRLASALTLVLCAVTIVHPSGRLTAAEEAGNGCSTHQPSDCVYEFTMSL